MDRPRGHVAGSRTPSPGTTVRRGDAAPPSTGAPERREAIEDPDATGPFDPAFHGDAPPGTAPSTCTVGDPFAEFRDLRKIDRFSILEPLGAGGEGIVFAAYDPRLDRRVALKILPRTHDDLPVEDALREARAMARLSDPHVLSVYDAGTVEGAVYVVLEFVQGWTLAAYLREHDPSPSEVLELYRQAGRGLAAAHRAGVVHGDFQPANVLVGDDGRVRVMDFGLARLAGADERHLSRFGTLAYMAPERLRGERGTAASDQFSFCVALYEGLYAARPFRWRTVDELVEAVTHGRVVAPPNRSGVPARVRRALVRGLAADPADRFPSMEALLARLSRFGPGGRVWSVALATTAIAAAVAGYSVQRSAAEELCRARAGRLQRIWNDERRERVAQVWQQDDGALAREILPGVDQALSRYAASWGAAAERACRTQQQDTSDGKAASHVAAYCLERNARAFEAFVAAITEGGRERILRAAEGAASLPSPETCDREAFRFDAAVGDVEAATALRARLDEALGRQLAGDYEGGVALARTVVEAATATGREDLAAQARLRLGMLEHYAGDYEASARDLEAAAFAADAAGADETLALARAVLVHVEGRHLADYDAARTWLRHAKAAVARAGAEGRDVEARVSLYEGMLAHDLGDLPRARSALERALALRTGLAGAGSLDVAEVEANLARVLEDGGDLEGALAYARSAFDTYAKVLGPSHPELAPKHHELGRLLARMGYHEEGLAHLSAAREGYGRIRAEGYPELGQVLADEARILARLGRTKAAEARFAEAAARLEAAFGPEHPAVVEVRVEQAQLFVDTGRPAEAERLLAPALSVVVARLPAEHPVRVRAEHLAARLSGAGAGVRAVGHSVSVGPGG
ncbi:MAG: serine/threonine protein kinase [Deltaproteobacteria bacterium]|nr:MAG: serine/threonine protein kinase [Deltaproteobacteria bacterium]